MILYSFFVLPGECNFEESQNKDDKDLLCVARSEKLTDVGEKKDVSRSSSVKYVDDTIVL